MLRARTRGMTRLNWSTMKVRKLELTGISPSSSQPGLGNETFGSAVAPGSDQCFAHYRSPSSLQPHVGAAGAAPRAVDGSEDTGLSSHEELLLFRRQANHPPPCLGISQRREDPTAHPKIGMPHVSSLGGVRETQREAAEFVRGHGRWVLTL